jgi:hypothetical protein
MLRIHSSDYDDFKEIVGELRDVSTWYSTLSGNKFVSVGSKSGIAVAVSMTPISMPSTFNEDFPDAINAGSVVNFTIDGTNV